MSSEEQELRRQLKEAHMSRALIYAAFYDALAERFDAETAEEVWSGILRWHEINGRPLL